GETRSETAAEAGSRLSPAWLPDIAIPDTRAPACQGRSRLIDSSAAGIRPGKDSITLSDREDQGERPPSRRYGRPPGRWPDCLHYARTAGSARLGAGSAAGSVYADQPVRGQLAPLPWGVVGARAGPGIGPGGVACARAGWVFGVCVRVSG